MDSYTQNITLRGYGMRLESAMKYAGDRIAEIHTKSPEKNLQKIVEEVFTAFSFEQTIKYKKSMESRDPKGHYLEKLNDFKEMAKAHFEEIGRGLADSETEKVSSFLRPDQKA